jgi:hypothetical protein
LARGARRSPGSGPSPIELPVRKPKMMRFQYLALGQNQEVPKAGIAILFEIVGKLLIFI